MYIYYKFYTFVLKRLKRVDIKIYIALTENYSGKKTEIGCYCRNH